MAGKRSILTNESYWRKRFAELKLLTEEHTGQYFINLDKQFLTATKNIEEKIDKFYRQFAESEGVTYLEAKKLLEEDELEDFHMSINEYIRLMQEYEDTRDEKIYKRLERASVKYRVSRLEAIELQLIGEVIRAYTGVDDDMTNLLKDIYEERYYTSAFTIFNGFGMGTTFSKINERELELLLKKPWVSDGQDFSDRVWSNKNKLIDSLDDILTQGLITGKSYTQMTDALTKRMDTENYKCRRVIATESAYFSSVAQNECFKELGVEKYEIVATLDMRTSEICQYQDGKVYDLKDFEPGKTAEPFHVNCRSVHAPYYDNSDLPGYIVGERAARGKNGETYYVPANMTYKEWYKKYILDDTQ